MARKNCLSATVTEIHHLSSLDSEQVFVLTFVGIRMRQAAEAGRLTKYTYFEALDEAFDKIEERRRNKKSP